MNQVEHGSKMKIGYVIDSTIDIPEGALKKYDIRVLPLKVIWGDREYLDRKTISGDEFFSELAGTDILPRSSSPSAGDFLKIYREMLDSGYERIISLHISLKLSGTVQAAKMAADMLDGKVMVFDSRSASSGAGFKMLEIIELMNAGGSWKEIDDIISEKNAKPELYFVVDDLNYLYKGGRIGRAKKIIGNMLGIKPLLAVEKGEIVAAERIIGAKNVNERIERIFKGWKKNKKDIKYIAVIYSNSKDRILPVVGLSKKYFPSLEPMITQVSPVIGCHAGPGLIAVGCY
jgi:DegV family protein with EDD domain